MNNNSPNNNLIQSKQLSLLYTSLPSTQVGMLLTGSILLFVMYNHISHSILYTWYSFLVLTITYRIILWNRFNHKANENLDRWKKEFDFGLFLSGMIWGASALYLYPENLVFYQVLLQMTLAGMVAISINTLSTSISSITIFSSLVLPPVIYKSLSIDSVLGLPLIALVLIYLIISLISSRKIKKSYNEYLHLKLSAQHKDLALKESEEKYRMIFANSEDPMMIFARMKIIEVNDAAVSFFGFASQKQLLCQPPFNLSATNQIDGISSQLKAQQLQDKLKETGCLRLEWLYKKKSGRNLPADVSLSIVPYEGKNVTFCIIRDISKSKKVEQELIDAQQKSDLANRVKSEFLANMSHEIRTPMNGILGMTNQLLLNNLEDTQKKRAHIIKQSAESLIDIINDILDFSKIEAGKLKIENHQFNLMQLIDNVSSPMHNRVKQKKLKFIYPRNNQELDLYLKADAGRIKQIITNLLDNAIKFTEKGKIILSCKLMTNTATDCTLQFNVTDTGIGLSPLQMSHIFERFSQADNTTTRKYGGTGLGLSICKQLSRLMGGDIAIKSRLGRGSNFRFTLKVQKSLSLNTNITTKTSIDLTKKFSAKALVVDDNKVNQIVAKDMLKSFGLSVVIADNGKNAIIQLKKQEFDLVFMDCQMPIMDGYEATHHIRNSKQSVLNPNIPIIAMTANAMYGDEQKCYDSGMDDYIAKPFDLKTLLAILSDWVSTKKPNKLEEFKQSDTHIKTISSLALFDTQYLLSKLNQNTKVAESIISQFLINIDEFSYELKNLMKPLKLEELKKIAHNIKGSAATVGCTQLSSTALFLENQCKDSSSNLVEYVIELTLECLAKTKERLNNSSPTNSLKQ